MRVTSGHVQLWVYDVWFQRGGSVSPPSQMLEKLDSWANNDIWMDENSNGVGTERWTGRGERFPSNSVGRSLTWRSAVTKTSPRRLVETGEGTMSESLPGKWGVLSPPLSKITYAKDTHIAVPYACWFFLTEVNL